MAAEVMYEGRVIRVEREPVTLSNGRTTLIEAVRHRGSVVILAQPSPDTVILIRQYRPVIGQWIWELPAGSLDAGEAPDTAVVRECEEETGWTPQVIVRLASWYPTPGICDELMHFYRCESLVTPVGPVHQDEDEQIEPAVVTLDTMADMIADGRVLDMKTVVGLGLLRAGPNVLHQGQ
jgi:ADP-ribose pyrophosphatase